MKKASFPALVFAVALLAFACKRESETLRLGYLRIVPFESALEEMKDGRKPEAAARFGVLDLSFGDGEPGAARPSAGAMAESFEKRRHEEMEGTAAELIGEIGRRRLQSALRETGGTMKSGLAERLAFLWKAYEDSVEGVRMDDYLRRQEIIGIRPPSRFDAFRWKTREEIFDLNRRLTGKDMTGLDDPDRAVIQTINLWLLMNRVRDPARREAMMEEKSALQRPVREMRKKELEKAGVQLAGEMARLKKELDEAVEDEKNAWRNLAASNVQRWEKEMDEETEENLKSMREPDAARSALRGGVASGLDRIDLELKGRSRFSVDLPPDGGKDGGIPLELRNRAARAAAEEGYAFVLTNPLYVSSAFEQVLKEAGNDGKGREGRATP